MTEESLALSELLEKAGDGDLLRTMDELVQAMGLSGISKPQVSKPYKDVDEWVHAFLDRPLAGEWP